MNSGYHARCPQPNAPRSKHCCSPISSSPPHRKPSLAITRAIDPATAMLCQSLLGLHVVFWNSMPLKALCFSSIEEIPYKGSRWQPNKPRPPQFLRGVSCICTVSDGPPELLGRRALTVIGIWRLSALNYLEQHDLQIAALQSCNAANTVTLDHSLLRSVTRPRPLALVARGLSNPPNQTWLCCRPF